LLLAWILCVSVAVASGGGSVVFGGSCFAFVYFVVDGKGGSAFECGQRCHSIVIEFVYWASFGVAAAIILSLTENNGQGEKVLSV
jgi:hypothetical protein